MPARTLPPGRRRRCLCLTHVPETPTRLSTVIMNMALLCLGIPFYLNRERPSIFVLGGKCLLMTAICYVFTFMCNSIDITGLGVSPALLPWLPVLVFTPVAVLLLDGIKT